MQTRPAQTSTARLNLWNIFDRKAAALSVTVVHTADQSAAAKAILDSTPDGVATDGLTESFPSLVTRRSAVNSASSDASRRTEVLLKLVPTRTTGPETHGTVKSAGGNLSETPREVVGVAALAVAETGSLLVCGSNVDRSMVLLAERLCLVVRAEDIVASLDQALVRAGELIAQGNRYATFMSGPSRTADIERTLTIGVHGPGALLVIVVGAVA